MFRWLKRIPLNCSKKLWNDSYRSLTSTCTSLIILTKYCLHSKSSLLVIINLTKYRKQTAPEWTYCFLKIIIQRGYKFPQQFTLFLNFVYLESIYSIVRLILQILNIFYDYRQVKVRTFNSTTSMRISTDPISEMNRTQLLFAHMK